MKTPAKPARDYTAILICLGALVAIGVLLWFFPLVGIAILTLTVAAAAGQVKRYGAVLAAVAFAAGAACFFGTISLEESRRRFESENDSIRFAIEELERRPGNRFSIDTLSQFSPRAKGAVPLLVGFLSTDSTGNVSVYATARSDAEERVLATPGLKPWERVQVTDSNDPALVEQMRNEAVDRETDRLAELYRNSSLAADEENRIAAIELLGKIGADARDAIPVLKQIADSAASERARYAAQQALTAIRAAPPGIR